MRRRGAGERASTVYAVTPAGVAWRERGADGMEWLVFPSVSDRTVWRQLAAIDHPQVSLIDLTEGSGARVLLRHPTVERKAGARLDAEHLSSLADLSQLLTERGLPDPSCIWVQVNESRGGATRYVCVAEDMGTAPNWKQLAASCGPRLPPVRRLPIHKRRRVRLGAMALVTIATAISLGALWPLQLGAFPGGCVDEAAASQIVSGLLHKRAEALVAGDFEALARLEGPGLVQRDRDQLAARGGAGLTIAPSYVVLVQGVSCDGATVAVLADIGASDPECEGCVTETPSRTLHIGLSRNPWLLQSVASPTASR